MLHVIIFGHGQTSRSNFWTALRWLVLLGESVQNTATGLEKMMLVVVVLVKASGVVGCNDCIFRAIV
jgi:hypothetical protein